ncbi:MAG: hypothetical protein ACFCU3_02920 [Verrucomicrobiales bacterium]
MGIFGKKTKKQEDEDSPSTGSPQHRVIKAIEPQNIQSIKLGGGSDDQSFSFGPKLSFDPLNTGEEANDGPLPFEDKDIYLEIADVVNSIPPQYLGDTRTHLRQRICLRLSEIFPDLSKGKATIPLNILYQFCPQIFKQAIGPEGADVNVTLPLAKLVSQVGQFQTRVDQSLPEQFQQIDTPIARVAQEDGMHALPLPGGGTQAGSSANVGSSPTTRPAPPALTTPAAPPRPQTDPSTSTPAPGQGAPPPLKIAMPGAAAPSMPPGNAPTRSPISMPGMTPKMPQPAGPVSAPPPKGSTIRINARQPRDSQDSGSVPPAVPSPSSQPARGPAPIGAIPSPGSNTSDGRAGQPGIKRPPATVRASFAGGKITLRPAGAPPIPAPPKITVPTHHVANRSPSPEGLANLPVGPAATPKPPTSSPNIGLSQNPKKITARIPIPPLVLQKQATPSAAPATQGPRVTNSSIALPKLSSPQVDPLPTSAPPPVLRNIDPPTQANEASTEPEASTGSKNLAFGRSPSQAGSENVSLELGSILRGIPPEMIGGPIPTGTTAGMKVRLPLNLIEPQLATGKVTLKIGDLLLCMPQEHHGLFSNLDPGYAVSLSLPEIFQNLPHSVVKRRQDQVVDALDEVFETPFSAKAEEDAERFGQDPNLGMPPLKKPEGRGEPVTVGQIRRPSPATAPPQAEPTQTRPPSVPVEDPVIVAKSPALKPQLAHATPAPAKAELATPSSKPVKPILPNQGAAGDFDLARLQSIFMTDEHLDAKNVVRLAGSLPGLGGCLLMFADGLPLANSMPDSIDDNAFSAIVPRFFSKVTDYAKDMKIGSVETVTVYTDAQPVSFFMHENICMALVHSKSRFLPGVRENLTVVIQELAKMYPAH